MKWPWERTERPLFDRPELNPDDAILLAEYAERLIESDIFVHSIERARARLRLLWQEEEDETRRERLWLQSRAFLLVKRELMQIVAEGKAAEAVREGDTRLTAVND